jgi:hypothetical protein
MALKMKCGVGVAWHHQRNLKAMANESVFMKASMKTLL